VKKAPNTSSQVFFFNANYSPFLLMVSSHFLLLVSSPSFFLRFLSIFLFSWSPLHLVLFVPSNILFFWSCLLLRFCFCETKTAAVHLNGITKVSKNHFFCIESSNFIWQLNFGVSSFMNKLDQTPNREMHCVLLLFCRMENQPS
jgi:hypothetical protein